MITAPPIRDRTKKLVRTASAADGAADGADAGAVAATGPTVSSATASRRRRSRWIQGIQTQISRNLRLANPTANQPLAPNATTTAPIAPSRLAIRPVAINLAVIQLGGTRATVSSEIDIRATDR